MKELYNDGKYKIIDCGDCYRLYELKYRTQWNYMMWGTKLNPIGLVRMMKYIGLLK